MTGRLIEWSVAAAASIAALFVALDIYAATRIWIVTGGVAALTIWIAVQDIKTFTIADGAVGSIACLALGQRLAEGDGLLAIGLDVLLTGGALLAFRELYYRHKGFDGLGLGDVKLAAAGGLLIGAAAFAWALLAASVLALGFVLMGRWLARVESGGVRWQASDKLAFGAFLAPAIWLVWVVQFALPPLPAAGA